MSPISLRLLGLSAALALLPGAGPGAAAPKTSADVVKATAVADKPDADGKQTVTITLTIDKGWHLHANPSGNPALAEAQTVVKVAGKGKPEVLKIDYPEGKLVKDKDVGDYKIYEGKAEIKAVVRRAKGDADKLEISVHVRADDDHVCLLGGTVKLTVP